MERKGNQPIVIYLWIDYDKYEKNGYNVGD